MSAVEMVEVDGILYRPEHAAAMEAREVAAEARRDAEAQAVAQRIASASADVAEERVMTLLREVTEPLVEAIENHEARIGELEAKIASNAPSGLVVPEGTGEAGSGAGGASGAVSGDVPAEAVKPAAKKGGSK